MNKQKQNLLDDIQQEIIVRDIASNLKKSATQLVFGDGSPDSEVVFIGEAPGKKEDEAGLPFVGAAGKFLEEMLQSIELTRQDVYITNIVKYRPPNNRDPLPDEKREFLPYLIQQINVIEPKLIVTLGRHSMECFLPGMRISQIHGQPKRIKVKMPSTESINSKRQKAAKTKKAKAGDQGTVVFSGGYSHEARRQTTQQSVTSKSGISSSDAEQANTSLVILPLYHPAAALYNGAMRQTLMDDFTNIPAVIKKITNETK